MSSDLEQIENAGDFLYRKCMEYIDTITRLTLENAELKHQLALERIKRAREGARRMLETGNGDTAEDRAIDRQIERDTLKR
jgi:hypothetical protein